MRGFVRTYKGNYVPRSGLSMRTPRNRYQRLSRNNNNFMSDRKVSYNQGVYVKRKREAHPMRMRNPRAYTNWKKLIGLSTLKRRPGRRFIAENIGTKVPWGSRA